MDKKTKVLIVVIVILVVSVAYLLVNRNSANKENPKVNNTESQVEKPNPMQAQVPVDLTDEQKSELKFGADAHTPAELTFHVTGGSFYFTPNEIKVKQGDKVTIIFTNIIGTHNFILEAFNVQTKTINTGESDTIEFIASKKGTFEFYCGVSKGYHRMKGQIGVLVVE